MGDTTAPLTQHYRETIADAPAESMLNWGMTSQPELTVYSYRISDKHHVEPPKVA